MAKILRVDKKVCAWRRRSSRENCRAMKITVLQPTLRTVLLAFFAASCLGPAFASSDELKVVSAQLGLPDYNQRGLQSGDFAIKPKGRLPVSEKYYGWVIEVQCPSGRESIEWKSITRRPAADPASKPGIFAGDPTVTVSADRKSFTTRRATLCRNGVARLSDIYAREPGDSGEWRIEVWHGKQMLAGFRYSLERSARK